MRYLTEADFDSLFATIREELDNYDYEQLFANSTGLIGKALPQEVIATGLSSFRSALVKPYWVIVERRDAFEQVGAKCAETDECLIVTDNRVGFWLAYDPTAREFLLVDQIDERWVSIGVRGDPVGCYLAM